MTTAPNAPANPKASRKILVVEDEEALALGIRDAIEHAGHTVSVAFDGDAALEIAQGGDFDLIVLDLMLPGQSGLDVLRKLRENQHTVRPRPSRVG